MKPSNERTKIMKSLKRLLLLVLCAVMIFTVFACQKPDPETGDGDGDGEGDAPQYAEISIGVLKGATGMGAVKLAKDAENGATTGNYDISFYETSTVSVLNADILNGTVDIAALPVNAGAALFNKSNGSVVVLAANALGVLSIVGTENMTSIADLGGKTIHTTGQASTPEYILNYILGKYELYADAVEIKYYADGNAALAALEKDILDGKTDSVAMLPEPATTSALANNNKLKIVFDVTAEWDKVSDTKLVQGCLVVNKAFLDANTDAVKNFLSEYATSITWIAQNTAEAAALMVEYGLMGNAQLAEQAIPRANIVCMVGSAMKSAVSDMLAVLYQGGAQSVGGKLPTDEYYYVAE